jgi:EmrB/QacA subfamily drug resistance transporter
MRTAKAPLPLFSLVAFAIGILMGALDHGILLPARHPIQQDFAIASNQSIWMVTIYTLFSSVAMPLVSKLSDRHGRQRVFLLSVITFAVGSTLAGLSSHIPTLHSYPLFLLFRALQAAGAGGIVPIASAEISSSFPVEHRGMALGMIGGIYGMASVLGPTVGTAMLDWFGLERWGWLFFINVPLAAVVLILSRGVSQQRQPTQSPFDFMGASLLTAAVASLLYALSNLNLFDFRNTALSLKVYPFLVAALLLAPCVAWAERRAIDPILNPRYFRNPEVLKVLALSFIVGIRFMFVIFMAQFIENILLLEPGRGGYHITFMAICAGISAPACGRLCDRFGARWILAAGFAFHIVGFTELAILVPKQMTLATLVPGLALVGIGMGFTLGTPLNYLMLQEVAEEDAATGLATLALVRSIGITLSPGILVGFVAEAGRKIYPALQQLFPMMDRAQGETTRTPEDLRILFENTNAATVMQTVRQIVPEDVLDRIGWMLGLATPLVRETYQKIMNEGFSRLFLCVAVLSVVGLIVIPLLKPRRAATPIISNQNINSSQPNTLNI